MPTNKQRARSTRSTLRHTLVTSELLDKATELFAAKGYEGTSLQDIADAVGVSRPALYHYVASKDDLLAMLVDQISRGLAEVLAELAARADLTPAEKLRSLTELLVRQRAAHPDQFRILDRSETVLPEPSKADHSEAKRRVLHEMVSVIDDGVAAGDFRPVDSRTAALSLLGMCNWVAWWFRPGSDVEPVVATITQFAESMLDSRVASSDASDIKGLIGEIRSRLDRMEQRSDSPLPGS
jgi:AcrR family transcriptional regulator